MTSGAGSSITEVMEDHDLSDRLHAMGTRPVPGHVRADHLHRTAAAMPPRRARFGRLAVAAAALVGFFAGSTGLAMAGALPDPAQDVAHDVLSVVQVHVPHGKEGKRGPCVSEAAKLEDPAAKQAAKDACPKGPPDGAGRPDVSVAPGTPGQPGGGPHADDPCKGPPPWAKDKSLTADERAALRTERAATCADAGSDADVQDETGEDPEEAPDDDAQESPGD